MSSSRFDVNLYEVPQSIIDDPFPLYEDIRAAGRIVWNEALGVWMIPGFEDCSRVLTDRGDTFGTTSGDPEITPWFKALNMIMVDGGEHERLRSFLAPVFTRSAVAKWEARVGEVVDQLLRPLVERSEGFDLIADFTMIPTVIVAEMLGIPEERHQDFRRWSHDITANFRWGHGNAEVRQVLLRTASELNAYVMEEVARHRKERPDDVITLMCDSSMTDEEIVSTSILLLVAGYDTTAKVMANCVIALERHPEQRALVAEDLSLVPAAVEEVLRWWGLLQFTQRRVVQDTVLAGTPLSKGSRVYTLPAAANRDPRRWPDPSRFDIQRELKAHLAFGYGPHLCIGAPLARLETKVALERLLRMAPEYRVRDVDFGSAFTHNRGPEQGIVEVGPRAGIAKPASR